MSNGCLPARRQPVNELRFKNLEILRIIGCIAVAFRHLFELKLRKVFPDIEIYNSLSEITKNGDKGVELFFMISGFLFAIKFIKNQPIMDLVKRKLIRTYPVLIFSLALALILSVFKAWRFEPYDSLLTFLCLNGTSLVTYLGENASQFWYVSAVIWTLVLFMYLLKNYEKKTVDLFIACGVFFSYSFLIHAKNGAISNHIQTFYHIFNVGMLRAFGGIGIGYLIGKWYKHYREQIDSAEISKLQKAILTVLEGACFVFVVQILIMHDLKFKNQIVFVISFAATLALFVSKKGLISKFFENDVFSKISRYTYSIYMTHIMMFVLLRKVLWRRHPEFVHSHPIFNIAITLSLVVAFGMLTYHLVEAPASKFLKEKFLKHHVPADRGFADGQKCC